MKKIEIEQIPFDLVFEGYYWHSNKSKPKVLNNETIEKSIFTKLPFIVEGNLFNKEKSISINIKNIDGQYLITQVDLTELIQANISEQDYLAHRLDKVKKIKLINYWQESEPDELLENMTTLVPVWTAFKGFVN